MKNRMKRDKIQSERLFSMTWPIVVELLITGLINTGSTYLLNRYSREAVAVVGSLSQIVTLTVNLYTIISIGGSVLLAPMIGAGKNQEAGKLIKTILYSNLLFSGIVSVVMVCNINRFLGLMQLDPSLYSMGREYLFASLGLSVMQSLLISYIAIFRSFGKMKDVLICNFTVFLVCFVVNCFIYYGISLEKQHLLFYTFAGIIGQTCGVYYLHIRLKNFFWKNYGRSRLKVREWKEYLKKVLQFGILGGMEGISYMVIQTLVVSMMGLLGTEALLVKAYVATFAGYMTLCDSALGSAVFVLTGQHLGEQNYEAFQQTHKESNRVGILLTALVGIILIVFSRPILLLFTKNMAVIHQVQMMLYIQLALEILRVPVALIVVELKGIGEVNIPFTLVIAGGLCNLSLSWIFGIYLKMGLPGIWIGYFGDLMLRLLIGGYYMKKVFKSPEKYLRKVSL